MSSERRYSYELPGGTVHTCIGEDEGVVNDSLGTIDLADSTGIDEELETGDAKTWNFPTRED